jgi:initiation factor 1A
MPRANKKTFQREKDDDHEYGVVSKKLGNGKFSVRLNLRNEDVVGKLCGRLKHGINKKQNFVEVGCVVLVSMRDYQESVVDIVRVFSHIEARKLKNEGSILCDVDILTTENANEEDNDVFDFEDI